MGLCVFFLICGPAAALLYFPLRTRSAQFQLAPARVSQTPEEPTTAAQKGLNAIVWSRESQDHFRTWKNAA